MTWLEKLTILTKMSNFIITKFDKVFKLYKSFYTFPIWENFAIFNNPFEFGYGFDSLDSTKLLLNEKDKITIYFHLNGNINCSYLQNVHNALKKVWII